MNENQEYNNGNIKPYKATHNLNTAIGNPSVNINDAMNVNIQNMATNTVSNSGVQNSVPLNSLGNPSVTTSGVSSNNNLNSAINTTNVVPNIPNNYVNNSTMVQSVNNQNNSYVKKTYVTTDNQAKKKKLALNLGSEFKIALLIMVILMVFVFLLPILSDMIRGY